MTRTEKNYGLPRLTVDEAARVLGTTTGELWIWINAEVKPGADRSSKWRNEEAPLPEAIIRLYLHRHRLRREPPGAIASRRR